VADDVAVSLLDLVDDPRDNLRRRARQAAGKFAEMIVV
jgi:hypothetical protein